MYKANNEKLFNRRFGVKPVKLFSSNAFTSEKETSETTEVRDEVLESARASYKADQEKKWTAEREQYQAEPERNRR